MLTMQGGKKGLIVNSTDICKGKHRAQATYSAQSGRRAEGKPLLRAKCKRHKKHKGHHAKRKGGGKAARR